MPWDYDIPRSLDIEVFDGQTYSWSHAGVFPFSERLFYDYSTATLESKIYLFGGYLDYGTSFYVFSGEKNGSHFDWEKLSQIMPSYHRSGHRSIAHGDSIYVYGGSNGMLGLINVYTNISRYIYRYN